MIKIAPSMLSCDFSAMANEAKSIENAGADVLHLDVMDGVFVPNISFGIPVIASLRPHTALAFDVHLMITEPERYIERFIEAGADWISVHFEACADIGIALDTIRLNGKRVGLAIKPATPAESIFPYLDRCDYILVMTVEPGFGGQALIPETLDKVRILRGELDRRGLTQVSVEVDGGINQKTAPQAIAAGADILVAGSSIFSAADRRAAIKNLRGEEK